LIDNYETNITLLEIIKEYNILFKLLRNKKYKLNKNSILICSIYKLLKNETDKKFYSIFNITQSTIKKFIEINN
jgi:hypothetical protein